MRSALSFLVAADFYPRPPRGGRPACSAVMPYTIINFYPRPPRGGRPWPLGKFGVAQLISIHALREEGDRCAIGVDDVVRIFLSTPSARRATYLNTGRILPTRNFYPRPPRGGRPAVVRHRKSARKNFYPRPPRGGRLNPIVCHSLVIEFLSTPSARRATAKTEKNISAFVSL